MAKISRKSFTHPSFRRLLLITALGLSGALQALAGDCSLPERLHQKVAALEHAATSGRTAPLTKAREVEILHRNLTMTGELFSDEYIRALQDDLPLVRTRIRGLYPAHDPALLIRQVESELGEQWLPLFIHPEVAKRWGEALEFAEDYRAAHPEASVHEVFRAFEESHGTVTLLRGMMLTADELENIRAHGMLAPALYTDPVKRKAALANLFDPTALDPNLRKTIANGYRTRVKSNAPYPNHEIPEINSTGVVMSFTQLPEVAKSVPYYLALRDLVRRLDSLQQSLIFDAKEIETLRREISELQTGGKQLGTGKRLYVFTVRLPAWQVENAKGHWNAKMGLFIGNSQYSLQQDARVEQFFPIAAPRESILKTEEIQEIPQRWVIGPYRDWDAERQAQKEVQRRYRERR